MTNALQEEMVISSVCPPLQSLCSCQDCEDHAVLLCSLLLGFGLQAFVCIGTKGRAEVHHWVMTQGHDGLVTFWESLTGQRSGRTGSVFGAAGLQCCS